MKKGVIFITLIGNHGGVSGFQTDLVVRVFNIKLCEFAKGIFKIYTLEKPINILIMLN